MTEGSQLYLAGPALVKAAIGQTSTPKNSAGRRCTRRSAAPSTFASRTIEACLERLRSLIDLLPRRDDDTAVSNRRKPSVSRQSTVYDIVPADGRSEYDVRDVLACIVDGDSLQEYKAEYGQTLVTAFAKIGGHPVGIVANQKHRCRYRGRRTADRRRDLPRRRRQGRPLRDGLQPDAPAARLSCRMCRASWSASRPSSRASSGGAKLVNAVSNSIVPKITVDRRRIVRRRQLCPVRQGLRSALILAWPSASMP